MDNKLQRLKELYHQHGIINRKLATSKDKAERDQLREKDAQCNIEFEQIILSMQIEGKNER